MDNQVCFKSQIVCQTCGKKFANRSGLTYHTQKKVCLKNSPIIDDKPKLVLKTKYENMTKEELINKLSQKDGEIKALTEHPQTVNNNIIVFPKEFGKEDMDYIQYKIGDVVGPLIKQNPFNSIPRLFTKIHNNTKIPEYHNVYSTSERSNFVMISDGKTFKHQPKKTIIDQIIESKRSIINQYIDENGDQLSENVLKKYDLYQERIDDDSEFRKTLELEIAGMLLDMKDVIANDEKTHKLLDKVNEGQFELSPADEILDESILL
jgi:hypothetical protein